MTAVELIEEIRKQAASMSEAERRQVAEELIAAGEDLIDDDDDSWLSPEYQAEIRRRAENVRSGRSVGRPADEVFADIRARFAR